MPSPTRVSIVIPCFNEASGLSALFARLDLALRPLEVVAEYVVVNDGSTDETLAHLIRLLPERNELVVVDLSRNFGKEAALTAGIEAATGDVVIPFDADLQDPPELVSEMLAKWREGFEVVLAKRVDRTSDSRAKRLTAKAFYKIHNQVSDVQIPADVGDFRLMDRRVVEALKQLPENRRFMKGIFAWVGFRSTTIEYKREPRTAGKSQLNGWRLWNLAIEGVTSFSLLPLRIWTYVGAIVAFVAMCFGGYLVVRTLIYGVDVPGYASIIVAVLFIGGIQLVGMGIIGEYLGRTYLESKRRPAYIVRRVYRGAVTTLASPHSITVNDTPHSIGK
jgi:polyisoprenyl-phosphate glycosyltransferase